VAVLAIGFKKKVNIKKEFVGNPKDQAPIKKRKGEYGLNALKHQRSEQGNGGIKQKPLHTSGGVERWEKKISWVHPGGRRML